MVLEHKLEFEQTEKERLKEQTQEYRRIIDKAIYTGSTNWCFTYVLFGNFCFFATNLHSRILQLICSVHDISATLYFLEVRNARHRLFSWPTHYAVVQA